MSERVLHTTASDYTFLYWVWFLQGSRKTPLVNVHTYSGYTYSRRLLLCYVLLIQDSWANISKRRSHQSRVIYLVA